MLILIEGIDRTGKSTLAERLSDFTGGTVHHFAKPECHPVYEYTATLAGYRPASHSAILDRSHVGESVWPLVFDRSTDMDEPIRRWLNMFYMSRGAIMLHAVRNVDAALAREFEEAGEPIYHLGDIDYAARLFKDAVADCGLPVWEHHHCGWPGAALHEAARRSVIAGELLDATPRFVGSVAPRLLVVGEWDDGRYLPFMPYEGTDGHFLLGELNDWRRTALVSCVGPNKNSEPLRALWFGLGKPHVVALGGEASAKLGNIPHDCYGPISDWCRGHPGHLGETLRRHL